MIAYSRYCFPAFLLALVTLSGLTNCSNSISIAPVNPSTAVKFEGFILATSDADQIASAYADGILNKAPGIEDSLFVLGEDTTGEFKSPIYASNSVISWPSIISVSPDKHYVYVAETYAPWTKKEQKTNNVYEDFRPGTKMQVFDISNPRAPILLQEKSVGKRLQSASVNYTGEWLVTSSNSHEQQCITLLKLGRGKIKSQYDFKMDEWIPQESDQNEGIRTVEFHPFKNILAANFNNTDLVFFKVLEQGDQVELQAIGSALKVAKHWSVGNWHPSGKWFFLSDVAWGRGTTGFIMNKRGALTSVAFDKDGNHEIISSAKVGMSPEGFDIAPNGKYAVACNMRRTYLGKSFPQNMIGGRKNPSLSLVKINEETGALTLLGEEYGFEGALPEDVIFDASSSTIAVAIYHDRLDYHPTQGFIEFWKLVNNKLIRTSKKIKVTRGVHNLKLVH